MQVYLKPVFLEDRMFSLTFNPLIIIRDQTTLEGHARKGIEDTLKLHNLVRF